MFYQARQVSFSILCKMMNGKLTTWALSCAFLRSIQTSFCSCEGGVSPRRETAPSHEASMNGQIRKQ